VFGFVIFWWKNIGTKAAQKMLMKLTTAGVIKYSLQLLGKIEDYFLR